MEVDAHEKCGGWDPVTGCIGCAPPGLALVLKGLGVEAKVAREAVASVEHEAELCTNRLWYRVRNREQIDAEREAGTSDALKHNRMKQREFHERRHGEGSARERLAEIAVRAREARAERRGPRLDARRRETEDDIGREAADAGDSDGKEDAADRGGEAVVCDECT